jgi:hypothetical protein
MDQQNYHHQPTSVVSAHVFPHLCLCSQTPHIKPKRSFVGTLMKISSSCWSSKIMSWRWTSFLKFERKVPLEKLRMLRQRIRREILGFQSFLRGLVSLKLSLRCLRTLIRKTSNWQQLDDDLMTMLVCCEVTLAENDRSLSRQASVLDCLTPLPAIRASPPVLLDTAWSRLIASS